MPFRDAESWLAERGVERDPIDATHEPVIPASAGERASAPVVPADRLEEPRSDDAAPAIEEPDLVPVDEEEVGKAVTYARRATSATPLSEGRLRERLAERGYDDAVIAAAMVRCRDEALVDDELFAAALVDEGKRKGHAPLRIRTDLEKRGFDEEVIVAALAEAEDTDPEAAAFAVARERAARLRGVETETAYRRLVGYLQRRGYTDALSRKVAREAVFTDREPERVAGH